MKTAAIIAEYNPFHNGHAYQIAQVRESLNVDRIVVIMSGNFVQRGTPAIFDKYTRTRLALEGGADLVIELPVLYALGSAEFFAFGAISILNALGNIDYLHFGSECGDLTVLQNIADILLEEPCVYKNSLQNGLKNGMSFPQARVKAFEEYMNSLSESFDTTQYINILSSPNNILGLEYLKALKRINSKIIPVTLQRKGAEYHEQTLDQSSYPSASGLRLLYEKNTDLSSLKSYMPESVWLSLQLSKPVALSEDDFSTMLHYKLLNSSVETLSSYQDVTPDLAVRIINLLPEFTSFKEFALLVKTKDLTYVRVCRCLCHILLALTKERYPDFTQNTSFDVSSLYCRILGFRKNSTDLLKQLKQSSSIPIISKLADASLYLSPLAQASLNCDLHATDLYHAIVTSKSHIPVPSEYRQEIIRL